MIDVTEFISGLEKADVRFVTGVPDSLLKDVCACITSEFRSGRHVIATNEGSAVALAIGHYLATSRPALVYMQNSGLGNIVNPIVSLADPEVYSIPMVLMIGWRGELRADGGQVKDEPQHVKQGRITVELLETLGVPHRTIDQNTSAIETILADAVSEALVRGGPVALLVRKNTFTPFELTQHGAEEGSLSREDAIRHILFVMPGDAVIVSTTGMASRELYELRKQAGSGHQRDFLTVGGMGHAGQIASGIAMACPDRPVVCIDGDGAILMHAGALAISADCMNLTHIVLNNEAHDSVGGQPTKGGEIHFDQLASVLGYGFADRASTGEEVERKLAGMLGQPRSALLEVRCRRGARGDLGRPDRAPGHNKIELMNFLRADK